MKSDLSIDKTSRNHETGQAEVDYSNPEWITRTVSGKAPKKRKSDPGEADGRLTKKRAAPEGKPDSLNETEMDATTQRDETNQGYGAIDASAKEV